MGDLEREPRADQAEAVRKSHRRVGRDLEVQRGAAGFRYKSFDRKSLDMLSGIPPSHEKDMTNRHRNVFIIIDIFFVFVYNESTKERISNEKHILFERGANDHGNRFRRCQILFVTGANEP